MNAVNTVHQTLWDLIKDIRFAMLTHRHADGTLHSHVLTTQNRSIDEVNLLYFFVSRKTEMGQRLRADGNVAVTYSDPKKDAYVSITGVARVNEDLAKKKELFNVMTKAWFPGGVEDPDLELIEIQIKAAEYWDVKVSHFRQLLKIATAAATGKPPTDMADHEKVTMG